MLVLIKMKFRFCICDHHLGDKAISVTVNVDIKPCQINYNSILRCGNQLAYSKVQRASMDYQISRSYFPFYENIHVQCSTKLYLQGLCH